MFKNRFAAVGVMFGLIELIIMVFFQRLTLPWLGTLATAFGILTTATMLIALVQLVYVQFRAHHENLYVDSAALAIVSLSLALMSAVDQDSLLMLLTIIVSSFAILLFITGGFEDLYHAYQHK